VLVQMVEQTLTWEPGLSQTHLLTPKWGLAKAKNTPPPTVEKDLLFGEGIAHLRREQAKQCS
jgi:hypothetical protein